MIGVAEHPMMREAILASATVAMNPRERGPRNSWISSMATRQNGTVKIVDFLGDFTLRSMSTGLDRMLFFVSKYWPARLARA
jgi:hypothetical protein